MTKLLPGVVASGISGNLFAPSGAYDSIATTTLTSTATSVTLSSIPSTYTHLQVRIIERDSVSGTGYDSFRFNSDTGSNYSSHYFWGNGATVSASADINQTNIAGLEYPGTSYDAGIFGAKIIDILDYANTNKNKTTRLFSSWSAGGTSGGVWFASGNWRNTSAITSITFNAHNTYAIGTQFALYGIKGN